MPDSKGRSSRADWIDFEYGHALTICHLPWRIASSCLLIKYKGRTWGNSQTNEAGRMKERKKKNDVEVERKTTK